MTRMKRVLRVTLALFMAGAGGMHLLARRGFMRIVPTFLPAPAALVLVSGVFEILGGLATWRSRDRASVCTSRSAGRASAAARWRRGSPPAGCTRCRPICSPPDGGSGLVLLTSSYPSSRIDTAALKQANPIEEVVARYGVELRPQGQALVGRCPLHADGGRPNLYVYQRTQTWRCYRCNVGGDVLTFVELAE